MKKKKGKILIAGYDKRVLLELKKMLKDLGYSVSDAVRSGEEAIKSIKENQANLILMDTSLQGPLNGIDTAEIIAAYQDIPVIYITTEEEVDAVLKARIREPYGYLVKPISMNELGTAIEMAFINRGFYLMSVLG